MAIIINTSSNLPKVLKFKGGSVQYDEPDGYTANGNPYYGSVEFEAGSYEKLDGTVIEYQSVLLTNVLVSISLAKNIVKTSTEGREGTIKEYTSSGDYQIAISGIITGSQRVFPVNEVSALNDILNVPDKVAVINSSMNLLGIDNIVITNFTLPQETGRYSQQKFSITAISDKEIDLVNV